MHVVHQPTTAARAHHLDRQYVIAIRALQLHAVCPPIVVPRNEERAFDDPIPRVIQIFLDHRQALPQYLGMHVVHRRTTLRTPQLTHPLLIVGFHGREELADRFVHGLRQRRAQPGIVAAGAAGKQEERKREPSLHEHDLVVEVTRR